jgi:hypothetical protein
MDRVLSKDTMPMNMRYYAIYSKLKNPLVKRGKDVGGKMLN